MARLFDDEHVICFAELRDDTKHVESLAQIDIVEGDRTVLRGTTDHQNPRGIAGRSTRYQTRKQGFGKGEAAEVVEGKIALDAIRGETKLSSDETILSACDPGAKHEIMQSRPAFRNLRRECIDIADKAEVRLKKLDVVVA